MKSSNKQLPARTLNIAVSTMLTQWMPRLEQKHFSEILSGISSSLKDIRINVFPMSQHDALSGINTGLQSSPYDLAVWHFNTFDLPQIAHIYGRWKKTQQAVIINSNAARSNCKHHIALDTWHVCLGSLGLPTSNVDLPFLEPGLYIMRPEDGARCLGQIVVDTRIVDLHHVLSIFKHNWFDEDFTLPDGVLIHRGFEKRPKEAYEQFKEGFFIQRVVENITEEYRLVVGPKGNITHALKRPRDHVGNGDIDFKTVISLRDELVYEDQVNSLLEATERPASAIRGDRSKMAEALDIPQSVMDEINEVVRKSSLECNSVDLFIRKSGDNVEWGIFEFCNQFSVSDWPQAAVQRLAYSWYEFLLRDYFEKRLASS